MASWRVLTSLLALARFSLVQNETLPTCGLLTRPGCTSMLLTRSATSTETVDRVVSATAIPAVENSTIIVVSTQNATTTTAVVVTETPTTTTTITSTCTPSLAERSKRKRSEDGACVVKTRLVPFKPSESPRQGSQSPTLLLFPSTTPGHGSQSPTLPPFPATTPGFNATSACSCAQSTTVTVLDTTFSTTTGQAVCSFSSFCL